MKTTGIYGVSGIIHILRAMHTRRVGVATITDSNGAQLSVTGHCAALPHAFGSVFGCYGTGAVPSWPGPDIGGGTYGTGGLAATGGDVGSQPAEFTAKQWPSAGVAGSYGWGNPGWQGTFLGNRGDVTLRVNSVYPIDLMGKIGYSCHIWRPTSASVTKLIPQISGGDTAAAAVITSKTTNITKPRSSDGIDEILTTWNRGDLINVNASDFQLSANYAGRLTFRPRAWTGGADKLDGDNVFGLVSHQVTDEEMFRGAAVSHLYNYGGQPSRTVAIDLCGVDPNGASMTNRGAWSGASVAYSANDTVTNAGNTYFCRSGHTSSAGTEPGVGGSWTTVWSIVSGVTDEALAARLKGMVLSQRDANGNPLPPMLLVVVMEGGNDGGDTAGSALTTTGQYRTANITDPAGNTRTGYYNNSASIARRIRYVWETVLGYARANLGFVFGCYPPQPAAWNVGAQWNFVRSVMPLGGQDLVASEPNCCFVDGYQMALVADMGMVDGTSGVLTTNREYLDTASPYTTARLSHWYRSAIDNAHFNEQFYYWWNRAWLGGVRDAAANAGLYNFGSSGRLGRTGRGT